uniref:Uncharacterized protein n=1 Tax=Arundo donax TaxID=35708 RepID=A0A0A9AW17_ARUDO
MTLQNCWWPLQAPPKKMIYMPECPEHPTSPSEICNGHRRRIAKDKRWTRAPPAVWAAWLWRVSWSPSSRRGTRRRRRAPRRRVRP